MRASHDDRAGNARDRANSQAGGTICMHGPLASATTFDWNEDSREARTECLLSAPDAGPRCAAFQKLFDGQENAIWYADTLPGAGSRQGRNQRSNSHDLS